MKRHFSDELRVERVKNDSATRIEISPPVVIELLPGYELTIEELDSTDRLEVEIWQESPLAPPVKLSFQIVAKLGFEEDFESLQPNRRL
jgi:hypothetical protein